MPAHPRAFLLLLALVASAGCGRGREQADAPGSPDSSGGSAATAAAALPPDGLRPLSIYLADPAGRRLMPVTRYVAPDSDRTRAAARALFEGPRPGDPAGAGTAVPPGSRLLSVATGDSAVRVDVSREFESGAGSAAIRMRLAQLVWTLTRAPTAHRVLLSVEGQPADVFSAEGLVVRGGLLKSDFRDLAPFDDDPPIVLEEPVPGSTVGARLTLRGNANVFEAHVGLRIRRPGGTALLETWTTATCGTGCRGVFAKTVELPDSVRGDLLVEAFEPSAKDGSDLHLVRSLVRRVP